VAPPSMGPAEHASSLLNEDPAPAPRLSRTCHLRLGGARPASRLALARSLAASVGYGRRGLTRPGALAERALASPPARGKARPRCSRWSVSALQVLGRTPA
jgi:hypothetical protein